MLNKTTDTLSEEPDYAALDLPDVEPDGDWAWQHRRSYIYRELMDVGHHGLLNKAELARKFDVSRVTIYKDLDHIAAYIEQNLGDHHTSESVAVFEKAVQELLDEGRFKEAAQVQTMMSEWLENRGELDREPDTIVEHQLGDEEFDFLEEVFE